MGGRCEFLTFRDERKKERKQTNPDEGWGRRTGSPPARAGFWKDDQGDRWGSPAPNKGGSLSREFFSVHSLCSLLIKSEGRPTGGLKRPNDFMSGSKGSEQRAFLAAARPRLHVCHLPKNFSPVPKARSNIGRWVRILFTATWLRTGYYNLSTMSRVSKSGYATVA